MLTYVQLLLIGIVPCAICFLEETKEYFLYDDVSFNETNECYPLDKEQYYLQTINTRNSSEIVKLSCLSKQLLKDKYFPKCCPPDFVYHRKHHKCVWSNTTNIHESFENENLLIRTDLVQCTVVLDHVFRKDRGVFTINPDRSLRLGGQSYKLGSYCLDNDSGDEDMFVVRTCEEVDVCRNEGVRCIKKCCPDGHFYRGVSCKLGPHFGLSLENNTRFLDKDENFNAVMMSKPCRRYIGSSKYNYHITEDGTAVVRELGVWKRFSLEENYYCMEYIELKNHYEILLCMTNRPLAAKAGVKGIFMIVSCICLLLTLIGYFTLPDLKNLIGNIIITYCSCFFVAFTILTWLQFYPNPGDLCDAFAFVIAFSFLTAFAWMTVLSYEIWRVLGSMVTEYGHHSPGERKRYLQYSLFGWLVPTAVVGISFLDYKYNAFPTPIHITLGIEKCVFENNRSKGMYGYIFQFAAPCGILLAINSAIFVKTITYILQVKHEIQKMRMLDGNAKLRKWRVLIADKEKVAMVIKLFLLMGLTWIFETISSVFVDFSSTRTLEVIESVFDNINALQGVFIFSIFILKKKILKSVLKILHIGRKSRRSSVATCSTEVVMLPTSARTSHSPS